MSRAKRNIIQKYFKLSDARNRISNYRVLYFISLQITFKLGLKVIQFFTELQPKDFSIQNE